MANLGPNRLHSGLGGARLIPETGPSAPAAPPTFHAESAAERILYIPNNSIRLPDAYEKLVAIDYPEVISKEDSLRNEREWMRRFFLISRAPTPVGQGAIYPRPDPVTSDDRERIRVLKEALAELEDTRMAIMAQLRVALAEGEMTAVVLWPNGLQTILEPHRWYPDTCLASITSGNFNDDGLQFGEVILPREAFEAWLHPAPKGQAKPTSQAFEAGWRPLHVSTCVRRKKSRFRQTLLQSVWRRIRLVRGKLPGRSQMASRTT